MVEDIQAAAPLGFFLAFMLGPAFFVLIETSIEKGFRAATFFDLGLIFPDIIFAEALCQNQILSKCWVAAPSRGRPFLSNKS